jgi:hypothetical protein
MIEIMKGRSRRDCSPFSTRVYRTVADRNRALKQLAKRSFNYFICYRSANPDGPALSCGFANWVGPRGTYIDR